MTFVITRCVPQMEHLPSSRVNPAWIATSCMSRSVRCALVIFSLFRTQSSLARYTRKCGIIQFMLKSEGPFAVRYTGICLQEIGGALPVSDTSAERSRHMRIVPPRDHNNTWTCAPSW